MIAITITWIATMNLPKLAVSELVSNAKMQFSFSQARRLVISNMNKRRVCKNSTIDHKNVWLQMIIDLAAWQNLGNFSLYLCLIQIRLAVSP